MFRIARAGLSLILVGLALGCALLSFFAPALQREAQARQVVKLRQFEKAADFATSYHRRTGRYPTEDRIGGSLGAVAAGAPDIGVDGPQQDGASRVGCDQDRSFRPAPADRFVLSAWNGDAFDCFAFPSGTTNLRTVDSDWPPPGLYHGAFALLFAFGAWAAWPAGLGRGRVSHAAGPSALPDLFGADSSSSR